MWIDVLTYTFWFALGVFFGIVCTFAFTEFANARNIEDICADLLEDE